MAPVLHRVRRLFGIYAAYHLPETSAHPRLARLRLVVPFVRVGVLALPAAMRWARHRDPAARARVKQLLDLSGPAPVMLRPEMFGAQPPGPAPDAVTLIMPVYRNLDLVRQALDHVVRHSDLPWRMIVIDDCSDDGETLPYLRDWVRRHPATLIENTRNLGFVGSVNRGLQAAQRYGDPVVLLNSDAMVPQGWARRLLAPIMADPQVGSVTPMSNDAELGSVPQVGRANPIDLQVAAVMDCFARETLSGQPVPVVTGVGFCMALNPRALEQVPQFDPVFAPGYGEEVDWCQKTAAKGFHHVQLPNLFVAHIGGQSFGAAQKQALIQRNSAILTGRYPRFDAQVHGFLRRDPLVTVRLALGLVQAEATRRGPLPVYLAHSMGGGAEVDLRRRLQADVDRVGHAVVIRVGGVFRFMVALWGPQGECVAAGCDDWDMVARLLTPVTQRDLVYSCAVGDRDPVVLPGLFAGLRGADCGLRVLMHDYFPLSPNPTLLEDGEVWRGLPDAAQGSAWHSTRRPDGTAVSLAQWRTAWGGLLAQADEVEHFCQTSRVLTALAYPGTRAVVRPHKLPVAVPALPRAAPGKPVLGLLGNLAPHKGAGVAERLSRTLRQYRDCDLVLLGGLDPAFRLHPPARMHGAYAVEDLPHLVARYGISCWLIPSLWPETFSFTTHEALATGLPSMVFDLGGQAEAAAPAPNGRVLPLAMAQDPVALLAHAVKFSRNRD